MLMKQDIEHRGFLLPRIIRISQTIKLQKTYAAFTAAYACIITQLRLYVFKLCFSIIERVPIFFLCLQFRHVFYISST